MGQLLKAVSDMILKALPMTGSRTIIIALGQLVYAILGLVTGHLQSDQAGVIATTALGLLTAAKHQPNP